MNMKTIVVGLDGSAESSRALEWAADLALAADAEITAVTVFDSGPYISWNVPDLEQPRATLRQELDSWCEPLRRRGVAHHSIMREGSPAEELLKEANGSTDLTVVGSRGRGGFRELLLGSVAHQVVQYSRNPVVVVPPLAVQSNDSRDSG
ncbi:MAG: universal stress protein [Candidatus Dormibacteraeota bacterium]|nr:universal stress protein [Candidatus Dormibacteraeota bacterium]